MSRYAGTESQASTTKEGTGPDWRRVPAYGPIDAVLGYGLFYVVVARATPTLVAGVGEVFPGVAPSSVRFATAAVLWFVLLVTLVDQFRRQFAALGLVRGERSWTWPNSKPTPTAAQAVVYAAAVVGGGAVAAWLFEGAVETAVSLIRILVPLDVVVFPVGAVAGLVVFFVAFGAATHSLDRLVVGAVRALLTWSLDVE